MTIDSHPTLPEFEYLHPATLAEASEFLAGHPAEARPFLGGTDVLVRMRDGFMSPKYLVDVKNLDGTNDLRFEPQRGLTIGAAVNMNRVIAAPDVRARYALLAQACESVASYQLRSRATIVGNICNASPAGDTIGACLVFKGVLHIHGVGGFREEPLSAFFLGPGKTTLKAGDVVTAVTLPPPPKGCAGTYLKLGRNTLSDLSIVGVTALGYPDPRVPAGYGFRIALASVAPVPLVPTQAEVYLTKQPVTAASIGEAARLSAEASTPIDDVRGGARYRKVMVRNLCSRALSEVWERLK